MLLVVILLFKRNINELNTQKGSSVNSGDIATKHIDENTARRGATMNQSNPKELIDRLQTSLQ